MSGSCFILTCYETVHRTVSAKFINEFGASCLLCFAQFTPPNKKQKAPKRAWTQCPSSFFNPSECNKLHPPSHLSVRSVLLHFVQRSPPETRTLCKGGKKVCLFYSARFSHFIDSLKPVSLIAYRFILRLHI